MSLTLQVQCLPVFTELVEGVRSGGQGLVNFSNQILVPDRFAQNVNTGFASYMFWEHLSAESLTNAVNVAVNAPSQLIDNSLPMKSRNG